MARQLSSMGIYSGSVLEAVYRIPRHLFVSEALRYMAYEDTSLPIGFGQTISKPSVIAKMVQALGLTGTERVLEIGTGSGYQSAIISGLAGSLVTMERIKNLHLRARDILFTLNCKNVSAVHTDDFNEVDGLFDAIIVAAGADIFPVELLNKLENGGVLVIPVGDSSGHRIKKYIKRCESDFIEENIGEARFVPYIVGETA